MQKYYNDTYPVLKKCPNCGYEWTDLKHLLDDPDVEVIGYQVNFIRLSAGYFMFNHVCKGTFTVPADRFKTLYNGPVYSGRATGSKACPGYCLHKEDMRPCPVQCECAYVREILNTIRKWPKKQEFRTT